MQKSDFKYNLPMYLLLAGLTFSSATGFAAEIDSDEEVNPDPYESVNRSIYKFNDTVDRNVLKPAAQAYRTVIPEPIRFVTGNFFSNLGEIPIIFNDILQLNGKRALLDTTRFLVNSTVGIFGIADVAGMIGIEKNNADFGQTLGKWGFNSGPYIVLPFFGPSSGRDAIGFVVDRQVDPVSNLDHIPTRNATTLYRMVDTRSNLLDASKLLDEMALDPYLQMREAYFQRRQNSINKAKAQDVPLKSNTPESQPTAQ